MKMKSEIWRVTSEKIGSLEAFSSERDMQSFLMNNPAIIGCWDPDSKGSLPCLIREELFIRGERNSKGRIDMVGLAKLEDGQFELRLFELKLGEIDINAVEQLFYYIEAWNSEKSPKSEIKRWALGIGLVGVNEANIDEIINNPVGILVGARFSPDAIKRALELKLKGIRLARFKGGRRSEHEYYVIIEDQIGEIVSSTKRYWSWIELINKGLINVNDTFSISHGDKKLKAFPDPKFLNYNWIKLIFDEESRKAVLEKKAEIREKADSNIKKWLEKDFEALEKGQGIWISHATALMFLAFGGPTACYWTPTGWWKHEKSGKWLNEIVKNLYE